MVLSRRQRGAWNFHGTVITWSVKGMPNASRQIKMACQDVCQGGPDQKRKFTVLMTWWMCVRLSYECWTGYQQGSRWDSRKCLLSFVLAQLCSFHMIHSLSNMLMNRPLIEKGIKVSAFGGCVDAEQGCIRERCKCCLLRNATVWRWLLISHAFYNLVLSEACLQRDSWAREVL